MSQPCHLPLNSRRRREEPKFALELHERRPWKRFGEDVSNLLRRRIIGEVNGGKVVTKYCWRNRTGLSEFKKEVLSPLNLGEGDEVGSKEDAKAVVDFQSSTSIAQSESENTVKRKSLLLQKFNVFVAELARYLRTMLTANQCSVLGFAMN
ncbi:hypothetical protein PIB30_049307 [Stylosanthes scabra]|uniref:Uncharacterized protein n=1 Tax=Stylosanthes scabra TaxID=79078 RepID=A0ABU6TJH3_9FABA|nr:hypothetical protein [Stylosanthes scabra]